LRAIPTLQGCPALSKAASILARRMVVAPLGSRVDRANRSSRPDPAPGGSHTGHRGRKGALRSSGRSCSWASPGSLTPRLGRHILARLMDRHAIVSECRQQAAHCRTRAETASDERVRALLVSMALIWTKLAEEAEPIQRTMRGVANDDTAGQTQVPRGSASDAMPTLQDTDESAQVRASPWTQVR
jgi:hypothetical protein